MENVYGGGRRTNENGLRFERETSLDGALAAAGCRISGNRVYLGGEWIAVSAPKNELYTVILGPRGVDWRERISRKILPDEAMLNRMNNTLYILEKKFQQAAGSVDEKLQTCDFKKRQYEKLTAGTGISRVEYGYVLCDFFRQAQYRDVREYIEAVGCWYEFREVPLSRLGLGFI